MYIHTHTSCDTNYLIDRYAMHMSLKCVCVSVCVCMCLMYTQYLLTFVVSLTLHFCLIIVPVCAYNVVHVRGCIFLVSLMVTMVVVGMVTVALAVITTIVNVCEL